MRRLKQPSLRSGSRVIQITMSCVGNRLCSRFSSLLVRLIVGAAAGTLGFRGSTGWGAEGPVILEAMRLASEAVVAGSKEDVASSIEKLEAAVALRPDVPQFLAKLAAAQVAADRRADAVVTLQRLAALGLGFPEHESEGLAALRKQPDFADVMKQFAVNARSKGSGELAFALRDVTGLIEGIAWRASTGEFFFGDVNGRGVWIRNKDNTLRRLTPEGDDLLGVFGLAIDEANGAIWAATSAVRAMRGYTSEQDGAAELAELDLATGAVRRTIPVPPRPGGNASHLLGDLTLAEDGTIFATDTGEPVLWHLPRGAAAMERFAESPEFISLQGIVAIPGALIVADRVNGLLRVDLARRTVEMLPPPADVTLVGIDGLILAPEGHVLAIQNGVSPSRVLRIELEADGAGVAAVTVLESGHLTMTAPSLGCIGLEGDLFFVGNAGWPRFERSEGQPVPARPVPIFKTKLKAAGNPKKGR